MYFCLYLDTSETENAVKLDDAYLKMKRLDKALEEAFEKEKQVKIETMSLMKKYVIKNDIIDCISLRCLFSNQS